MASASFTHGMDPELRAEIEKIARFEDRSASYVANLAIRGFVDERQATRDLVREGLRQVETGAPSIPPDEVRDWLLADVDRPFPEGWKAPLSAPMRLEYLRSSQPGLRWVRAYYRRHPQLDIRRAAASLRTAETVLSEHPAAGRRFEDFEAVRDT